jgi:hypothetical protein
MVSDHLILGRYNYFGQDSRGKLTNSSREVDV